MPSARVTNFDRVQGFVPELVHFVVAAGAAVADYDGCLWTADADYELVEAFARWQVLGAAATLSIVKVASGTARSAGTLMTLTGWDVTTVADTPVVKTPSATLANTRVARLQSVGLIISGASAGLDGVSVTVVLRPFDTTA